VKAPAKTVTQQARSLKRLSATDSLRLGRGRLRWRGQLRPTPLSARYTIDIDYAPPKRPKVSVIAPQLRRPDDKRLPHTFRDGTLCLCYSWQWRASDSIAATIVPWASEWLLNYELWLITDEWHGGGHGTEHDSFPV
jgi:transglutaminase-like putative cysteine protease